MSRLLHGTGAMPIRPGLLHEVINARDVATGRLNETERTLLAAVELVEAVTARRASLDDAIEVLRETWDASTEGGQV